MSSTCITTLLATPNGLSYFNGTACPIVSMNYIPFEKISMDILKAGLKEHSLNELKNIHLQQMTDMENLLIKVYRDNGVSTKRNIKKWLKQMNNRDEARAEILWYSNVYILLKLKVIKNDNNNGMMFCHTN